MGWTSLTKSIVVVAGGGSLERSGPSARADVVGKQRIPIPTQMRVCAESRINRCRTELKGIKVSANLRAKRLESSVERQSMDEFECSIIQAMGFDKPYAQRLITKIHDTLQGGNAHSIFPPRINMEKMAIIMDKMI